MKSYGLGWRLVFVAGFFPAIAGGAMLALAVWSATLGQNDLWLLTVHPGGVNLAISGATISVVAWFALRDGRPWAWPFLWVLVFWVGLNHAVAPAFYPLTVGAGIPYVLIPLALASVGLLVYRTEQKSLASPDIAEPPRFCDQRFCEGGNWITLPETNGFTHRYLSRSPVIVCETLMSAPGDSRAAMELLRGPWDWWEHGRTFAFQRQDGDTTDQILVPVAWYWAHVRMRTFPPVELPELSGWRIPLKFAGAFIGSASLDIYPGGGPAQIVVRGRFHAVVAGVPGPRDFVTESHLRAESGTLPFPFPRGTGWVGLRGRLAERLTQPQ